jgi:hypothetical protein
MDKTKPENAWRIGYANSLKLNLFCMGKTG